MALILLTSKTEQLNFWNDSSEGEGGTALK